MLATARVSIQFLETTVLATPIIPGIYVVHVCLGQAIAQMRQSASHMETHNSLMYYIVRIMACDQVAQ